MINKDVRKWNHVFPGHYIWMTIKKISVHLLKSFDFPMLFHTFCGKGWGLFFELGGV